MLALQEALRAGATPESLKEKLGIAFHRHPELPLVGFSYSQTDSPKKDPIVRSSRGTLLEEGTWDLVAQSFYRFFNLGEVEEELANFNWSDFSCMAKEDGSLILLYNYRGAWYAKTRGSFATGQVPYPIPGEDRSFEQTFWDVLLTEDFDIEDLNPDYTYVFELCTVFNKVVRSYPQPAAYLLSVFDRTTTVELTLEEANLEAARCGLLRPVSHSFSSLEEVQDYIRYLVDRKQDYPGDIIEGVIIRDSNNMRYKVKNPKYVGLHHLHDNGNIGRAKRLLPFVLSEDPSEVLLFFPEVEEHLKAVTTKVNAAWDELRQVWEDNWKIQDQKEFALAIKGKTRFMGLLFRLRKSQGQQVPGGFTPGTQTLSQLRDMWKGNAEGIRKTLFP